MVPSGLEHWCGGCGLCGGKMWKTAPKCVSQPASSSASAVNPCADRHPYALKARRDERAGRSPVNCES